MTRRVSLADLPPAIVSQLRAKFRADRPAAKPVTVPTVDWSDYLAEQLRARGVAVQREFQFHPTRKWRVDVALPAHHIAIEVEGLGKGGKAGRHQRADGFAEDCVKYAELVLAGWRLFRVTTRQVRNDHALQWVLRALEAT